VGSISPEIYYYFYLFFTSGIVVTITYYFRDVYAMQTNARMMFLDLAYFR
jgi:hypothetical protein